DFYRYFIGRPDQSVNLSQTIKYSSHQAEISRRICTLYDLSTIENKKLRKLMERECNFLITIAVCFLRFQEDGVGEKQYKELWESIKEGNPKLYRKLRHFSLAGAASIPGKFGRIITIGGYHVAHRLVKFN
ncbi:MAG: hypothetical protein K2L98_04745, partial [Bacilli bacterium]|nr:hypothetical protein [Bacilli bacterium]